MGYSLVNIVVCIVLGSEWMSCSQLVFGCVKVHQAAAVTEFLMLRSATRIIIHWQLLAFCGEVTVVISTVLLGEKIKG